MEPHRQMKRLSPARRHSRPTRLPCIQWTRWRIGVVSLLLLSTVNGLDGHDCPYNGRLAMWSADPLLFVGGTSMLCCQPVGHDGEPLPWTGRGFDLTFSSNVTDIAINQPFQTERGLIGRLRAGSHSNNPVCVNVTVAAPTHGVCMCQVRGHAGCRASKDLIVDEPLPSQPNIACVAYGYDNITCHVTNGPIFLHGQNVRTVISWKQAGALRHPSITRSKACAKLRSCLLVSHVDVLLGLPLTLDIWVRLEYNTSSATPRGRATGRDSNIVTVTSDRITFDIEANTQLDALRASVVETSVDSMKIRWDRQLFNFDEKLVRISYIATDRAGEGASPHQEEVRETVDFSSLHVEFVITDLRPSTRYQVRLTSRPVTSRIWSGPTDLTASTLPTRHQNGGM